MIRRAGVRSGVASYGAKERVPLREPLIFILANLFMSIKPTPDPLRCLARYRELESH